MKKITLYFFILMSNIVAINAQTDNKARLAIDLPPMFKELQNGRPSPESLQQNPVNYYAAERRYDSLFTLLLQEVAAGRIPKSVLSVLQKKWVACKII